MADSSFLNSLSNCWQYGKIQCSNAVATSSTAEGDLVCASSGVCLAVPCVSLTCADCSFLYYTSTKSRYLEGVGSGDDIITVGFYNQVHCV